MYHLVKYQIEHVWIKYDKWRQKACITHIFGQICNKQKDVVDLSEMNIVCTIHIVYAKLNLSSENMYKCYKYNGFSSFSFLWLSEILTYISVWLVILVTSRCHWWRNEVWQGLLSGNKCDFLSCFCMGLHFSNTSYSLWQPWFGL